MRMSLGVVDDYKIVELDDRRTRRDLINRFRPAWMIIL